MFFLSEHFALPPRLSLQLFCFNVNLFLNNYNDIPAYIEFYGRTLFANSTITGLKMFEAIIHINKGEDILWFKLFIINELSTASLQFSQPVEDCRLAVESLLIINNLN